MGPELGVQEDDEVGEHLGDPLGLGESPRKSSEVLERLEHGSPTQRSQVLEWLLKAARPLALSKSGTRVVQRALEVAGGPGRDALVAELAPHAVELYESLHGNHVLTKVVEMMPSAALGPLIERLVERGPTAVARHRFGCRVMERLIEHCSETELGGLLDEIVAESGTLCRHPYGNFVVQHLLEHGTVRRQRDIMAQLLGSVPQLAMHRTASHVVQRALYYSEEEQRLAIVDAMLQAESPNSLVEVACSRYGSFVVEQLAGMRTPRSEEVYRCISNGIPELVNSQFGIRVASRFGFEVQTAGVASVPSPAEAEEQERGVPAQ